MCVRRGSDGWTGRRFHLGINKEVFDAVVCAIYQALCILDRQQECGHKYTIFSDSTAAIDINRVRMDTTGPGLRLAIAAREVCSRVLGRDNEVTTRWVPAHTGITGNKGADEYAKAAAGNEAPYSEVLEEYWWETSLSHMTWTATVARSCTTSEWISSHMGA